MDSENIATRFPVDSINKLQIGLLMNPSNIPNTELIQKQIGISSELI